MIDFRAALSTAPRCSSGIVSGGGIITSCAAPPWTDSENASGATTPRKNALAFRLRSSGIVKAPGGDQQRRSNNYTMRYQRGKSNKRSACSGRRTKITAGVCFFSPRTMIWRGQAKKSPDARGFAPGEGAGEFFQPSGYVHNVRYLKHMAGSTGARAKGIQIHRKCRRSAEGSTGQTSASTRTSGGVKTR